MAQLYPMSLSPLSQSRSLFHQDLLTWMRKIPSLAQSKIKSQFRLVRFPRWPQWLKLDVSLMRV